MFRKNMELATRILTFILSVMLIAGCSTSEALSSKEIDDAIEHAERQLERTTNELSPGMFPKASTEDGTWTTETILNKVGWTMGFFPGCLWYMYDLTDNKVWRERAEEWTESLEEAKNNRQTHDMGFIFMCSYGNGLRLTKNQDYKDVMLTAAKTCQAFIIQRSEQ